VISGFNSDIEFQGTVYHVQTEDKGLTTPILLSLIYSRGEILASKRSPYDDLIAAGFNEAELTDRLQRQHKLIIAAIRAGRIDDLKRMTMKESERKRAAKSDKLVLDIPLIDAPPVGTAKSADVPKPVETVKPAETPKPVEAAPKPIELPQEELAPVLQVDAPKPRPEPVHAHAHLPAMPYEIAPIPRPDEDLLIEIPIDVIEEPFFEEVEVVEYEAAEEMILPSEAVKIITDNFGVEDEDESRLKIRLLGRTTFFAGQEALLDILVARGGKLGHGISGAHIMVKVLGTSFKPMIFHTRADDNGISQVNLQLPDIRSGRAAILIKALSDGEEVELRQIITQR
jgi:hypothetical protein